MRIANFRSGLAAGFTATLMAGAAWGQDGLTGLEVIGSPHALGTGFQPAVTELARDQQWLDAVLHLTMAGIVVLVLGLLAYVILRFNTRANPTPARFSHNTPIEIIWTVVPIVILVVLAAITLPILFKQQEIPTADLTIKATGFQWFWGYEYVDDGVSFDSYLIGSPASIDDTTEPNVKPYILDDAMVAKLEKAGYSRDEFLLATTTAMVVPVNKTIVVQVTATDVIHSWTIPAFAVKQDAVPGRIAELWFKAEKEGIYFGQCSELCGKDHAFMPITVKVVSQPEYDAWLARARVEFAGAPADAMASDVKVATSN